MSPPLVSVVIPAYRAAATIGATVESLLAQTRPPDEILVVDDGSPDDLAAVLAPYHDMIRLVRKPNGGASTARNLGVSLARGRFVAFLDADDVWHPQKLAIQLGVMASDPRLVMLGTAAFDYPGEPFPRLGSRPDLDPGRVAPRAVTRRELAVKNPFITSSLVVTRAALARAGEFDTSLYGPEDHDLWLRVAAVGRVAVLPLPLTGYRNVEGSLSKHARRMQEGMLAILRKLDAGNAWGREWLHRRRAYGYCYYSCAYMYAAAGDHRQAFRNSLASLAWYPLPYTGGEMKMPFARLRQLARTAYRAAGQSWSGLTGLSARPAPGPGAPTTAGPGVRS